MPLESRQRQRIRLDTQSFESVTWRPERVLLGAYLFGGATIVQFFAQGSGIAVPTQLLSSLPYFATVLVLVIISRNAKTIRLNSPMSLGRSYRPE